MPKNRPGLMKYAVATKLVVHGAPVIEATGTRPGLAGVAVKQRAMSSGAGAGAVQSQIQIGESFAIISKGLVEVPTIGGAVKGDPVWINVTNNALTLVDPGAGNGRKYGTVSEVAGERGGRTTHMRVDLDAKNF